MPAPNLAALATIFPGSIRHLYVGEQGNLTAPPDRSKRECGAQKGVNVLHSCNGSSLQQLRESTSRGVGAGQVMPPAGRRHRVWLRALLFLLGVICGTPGRQRPHLALTTPWVLASNLPTYRQHTSRQNPSQEGPGPPEVAPSTTLSKKQKKDLLKDNFAKMKREADELADLAKSLQEDLNNSNENVLSLRVVDKAEKIEKLAKKIKGTARGF